MPSQPISISLGQRCIRVVTCHLHFWHDGRGLLRATAITQGCYAAQKVNSREENSSAAPTGDQTCDLSLTCLLLYQLGHPHPLSPQTHHQQSSRAFLKNIREVRSTARLRYMSAFIHLKQNLFLALFLRTVVDCGGKKRLPRFRSLMTRRSGQCTTQPLFRSHDSPCLISSRVVHCL